MMMMTMMMIMMNSNNDDDDNDDDDDDKHKSNSKDIKKFTLNLLLESGFRFFLCCFAPILNLPLVLFSNIMHYETTSNHKS